jgi:DNA-binding transcriptional ArsR family regulator
LQGGCHLAIKEIFKALSDENRRDILEMLKNGKMNAGDISSKFNMTQATVSHHLSILKEADLVRINRDGKYIYYELNTTVFNDVLKWILDFKGVTDNEKKD